VCLLRGTDWIFISPSVAQTVPAASYYLGSAIIELFNLRLRKSELNSRTVPCQQSYFLLSLWYEKPAGIPDSTTALLDTLIVPTSAAASIHAAAGPMFLRFLCPLSCVKLKHCHLPGKCQLCHLYVPNFPVLTQWSVTPLMAQRTANVKSTIYAVYCLLDCVVVLLPRHSPQFCRNVLTETSERTCRRTVQ
jgi:hypothetical protein